MQKSFSETFKRFFFQIGKNNSPSMFLLKLWNNCQEFPEWKSTMETKLQTGIKQYSYSICPKLSASKNTRQNWQASIKKNKSLTFISYIWKEITKIQQEESPQFNMQWHQSYFKRSTSLPLPQAPKTAI